MSIAISTFEKTASAIKKFALSIFTCSKPKESSPPIQLVSPSTQRNSVQSGSPSTQSNSTQSNSTQSNSNQSGSTRVVSAPIKSVLSPQEALIKNVVSDFLEPYLQGKITKENEPKNRELLVHLLEKKLQENGHSLSEDLKNFAILSYMETAVSHFKCTLARVENEDEFLKAQRKMPIGDAVKMKENFQNALKQALKKDFPSDDFSEAKFDQRLKQAYERDVLRLMRESVKPGQFKIL